MFCMSYHVPKCDVARVIQHIMLKRHILDIKFGRHHYGVSGKSRRSEPGLICFINFETICLYFMNTNTHSNSKFHIRGTKHAEDCVPHVGSHLWKPEPPFPMQACSIRIAYILRHDRTV